MAIKIKVFIATTILYIIGCILYSFEEYDYSLFTMYLLYFPVIGIAISCPAWDSIKEDSKKNKHLNK